MKRKLLSVFSANFAAKLLGGAYIILMIRKLTITEYALFTNFQSVYGFVSGFVFSAFNHALVKYGTEARYRPHDLSVMYSAVTVMELSVYGVLLAVAFFFSESISLLLFKDLQFAPSVLYGCIAALGLILSNLVLSCYQAEADFRRYNIANISRPVLTMAGTLLLYFTGRLTFINIAWVLLFSQLLPALGFIRQRLTEKRFFQPGFSRVIARFTGNSQFLILYFLVFSLFEQFGVFVLSRYSNAYELANFGVAFRYYNLSNIILLTSINVILLPFFSQDNAAEQAAFVKNWIKKTVLLILPLGLVLYFGQSVYTWVNGEQYTYSYRIFCVFAVGTYLTLVFGSMTNALTGRGEFKFLFLALCFALALHVFFSLWGVNRYGALGVALSSVVSYNLVFNLFIAARAVKS